MTTIMIVEDNAISARVLEVNLTKANYRAVTVPTGKEAVRTLESGANVDLIITDIVMADMDGFRLLRDLKASDRWKRIPVIMCTSFGDPENVKKAVILGCRHYLVKPIQPGLLLRKVAEALSTEKPALKDKSEVLVQFGLDDEAYREVAAAFDELVKEQIALLERLEKNRTTPLRPALRGLSEGAQVLGAERLTECLTRLLAGKDDGVEIAGWLPGYRQLLEELQLVDQTLAPILV
jgi:CheY-like chemotaxis protein